MIVYQHSDPMAEITRARRWTVSEHDSSHRYYDFRAQPELITEVLEDFRPYSDQPAVIEFYEFVANTNGDSSHFETNDCAFKSPHPNTSKTSPKTLQASGRVMFYFRDLSLNVTREYEEWLEEGVLYYLGQVTPDFADGAVGTSVMKMHMPELASGGKPADAFELCLHFWSWGDTESEVWSNLQIVVHNIHWALAALSHDAGERRYLNYNRTDVPRD